jgi:hypothetical protein
MELDLRIEYGNEGVPISLVKGSDELPDGV